MKKFAILFGAILSVALSICGVNAQTARAGDDAFPVCQTNTGIPGVIFEGHMGTLTAPRNFGGLTLDDVGGDIASGSIGNGRVEVFSNTRFRQEVLVFGYPNADKERTTVVHFFDAFGRVKSSCEVFVVPLDIDVHDFAETARGYCRFGQLFGLSQLSLGQSEVFDLPEKYREGTSSPTQILDHSPEFGALSVRLTAGSEGYATFAWMGEDTGSGTLKGLCPFVIVGGL